MPPIVGVVFVYNQVGKRVFMVAAVPVLTNVNAKFVLLLFDPGDRNFENEIENNLKVC